MPRIKLMSMKSAPAVDGRRSTPHVTHQLASMHHRSARSEFVIGLEVDGERIPNRVEPLVGCSMDHRGHAASSASGGPTAIVIWT